MIKIPLRPFATRKAFILATPIVVALFSTPVALAQFEGDDVEILWVSHSGESARDQYGWQCEAIGDLNGDGHSEIATSAPFSSRSGGPGQHGKVYVVDGRTGHPLKSHVGTRQGGGFGFRIYAGADFDGDGTPDYLVTEAGIQGQTVPDQRGPGFRGYVHILSGRTHRALLTLEGPDDFGRLGMAAAVLDDIDGDGTPDVVAGACQASLGGTNSGAAYVFSGEDGSILRTHAGSGPNALFGNGITRLDDITGDELCEYAIGSYGEGTRRRGRVRIFDGESGDLLMVIDPNDYAPGNTTVDLSRFFLSSGADVDGDGVHDLYVGDWFDTTHGSATGRVWVFSSELTTGGAPPRLIRTVAGTAPNEWLGFGRLHGDVDGDGGAELLICSNGIDNFSGAVGVYSSRDGSRLRWIEASRRGHSFGYDACSPGDLDGDDIPDIIVTSSGSQGGGVGRFGSTYAIRGRELRAREASTWR